MPRPCLFILDRPAIFVNVLLDKAIITSESFTALLLMAVASTMLTIPWSHRNSSA